MKFRPMSASGLVAAICWALIPFLMALAVPAFANQASVSQNAAETETIKIIGEGAEQQNSSVHIKVGWINMPPFQHPVPGKLSGVEGLDIDILTRVTNALKIEVKLTQRNWDSQLQALEEGRADMAMGAFKPENGDDRFYYSLPYRKARVTFLVRNEDRDRYQSNDPASLIEREAGFRIGYIPGRLFPQQKINDALSKATAQGRAVEADTDEENLRNLLAGRIDGFFSDRLSIGAIELNEDLKFAVSSVFLSEPVDVYFLLSKKTMSPSDLDEFNNQIKALGDTGELKRLLHAQIFSVIIGYLFESLFFKSVVTLAIVAAAISGLLIGYKEGYTLAGMLFLAVVTALGGGLLRDLILDRRPAVLANPIYLKTVLLTALAALCLYLVYSRLLDPHRTRLWTKRLPRWISFDIVQETFDAAGLAAFTVVGVAVALAVDVQPLWLWGPICGMLTGAGGGIARDIIRQTGNVATLKSEFYIEIPLFWGLVLSIFLLSQPMLLDPRQVATAIVGTGLAAFLTRMAAVYIRMRADSQKLSNASPPSSSPPKQATDPAE